jgi:hypothetical protein
MVNHVFSVGFMSCNFMVQGGGPLLVWKKNKCVKRHKIFQQLLYDYLIGEFSLHNLQSG